MPGNFIGFYIYGEILRRRFTWPRFIIASLITLMIGNAIVAFLYVFLYRALFLHALPFSIGELTLVSIGLTIYWFVTMLPFMLLVTPLLIHMVAITVPGAIPEYLHMGINAGFLRKSFMLATILPRVILIFLGITTSLTPLKDFPLFTD